MSKAIALLVLIVVMLLVTAPSASGQWIKTMGGGQSTSAQSQ